MFATNTAPSRNDLAKVRKIVMQSKHLQPVIDFLASFCCEGDTSWWNITFHTTIPSIRTT